MIQISVVISTHNPNEHRLALTLLALSEQSLPPELWELVLVDNASAIPVAPSVFATNNVTNGRLISEPQLGLSFGRLAGVENAKGTLIAFVDDDNVLCRDYLARSVELFSSRPDLGLIGGPVKPKWQNTTPPGWVAEFAESLALRDLGDEEILTKWVPGDVYPHHAPIGAGMVARRAALDLWLGSAKNGPITPGRQGNALTSSEGHGHGY